MPKINKDWNFNEDSVYYYLSIYDCCDGDCVILKETDNEITVRFVWASACYGSNGQVLGVKFFTEPVTFTRDEIYILCESDKQMTPEEANKRWDESVERQKEIEARYEKRDQDIIIAEYQERYNDGHALSERFIENMRRDLKQFNITSADDFQTFLIENEYIK